MIPSVQTIEFSRHPAASAAPGKTFVAGPENRLAAATVQSLLMDKAAEQAAAPPLVNPLVLYGPSGTGKTFIARGLAAAWGLRLGEARVTFLAGCEFAQQFAGAVHAGTVENWRQNLHGAGLLVLDDVDSLAERRSAQQELCRLLDVLVQGDALVVVTGCTLPSGNTALLAVLRSRLAAGLAIPLALPGAQARRVLLELAAQGRKLPPRALHALADSRSGPLPELLAALAELESRYQGDDRGPTAAEVRQFLTAERRGEPLTLRAIALRTAKHFRLKLSDLKSPSRCRSLVCARGVAICLARRLTDKSLDQIGAYFGGRDHTTVLSSQRRTESLARRDGTLRSAIAQIEANLQC